jgi:hypothetical protein
MSRLGAKGAILRTASGLGIHDGAELDFSAVELIADSTSAMKKEGKKTVFNL